VIEEREGAARDDAALVVGRPAGRRGVVRDARRDEDRALRPAGSEHEAADALAVTLPARDLGGERPEGHPILGVLRRASDHDLHALQRRARDAERPDVDGDLRGVTASLAGPAGQQHEADAPDGGDNRARRCETDATLHASKP